jgi:uncharacterized protein YgbK (DUF1537 family)
MLVDTTDADVTFRQKLGAQLGCILKTLLLRTGVRRAVVAGGDTSGHGAQQLGLFAVTMVRPLVPGCPLCMGYCDDAQLDGLEIVFKGGQMGDQRLFGLVRDGGNRV